MAPTTERLTDHADDLMARYANGDDSAFRDLHAALAPWLARRLRALSPCPDDLVQEAFLKLHRARARYRPGTSVVRWLFVIARRLAFDDVRRARPTQLVDIDDEPQPSRDPDALGLLEAAHTAAHIEATLATLPRPIVEALRLARFDGLTPAEVGQHLGVAAGLVRVRVHRGAEALRRAIAGRIDEARTPPHHRRHARAAAGDRAAPAVA